MITKCPKCEYENWSIMDKKYASLFGCWSCDKKQWEQKKITTEEFEKREQEALNITK